MAQGGTVMMNYLLLDVSVGTEDLASDMMSQPLVVLLFVAVGVFLLRKGILAIIRELRKKKEQPEEPAQPAETELPAQEEDPAPQEAPAADDSHEDR
jgi:hypothetical protein